MARRCNTRIVAETVAAAGRPMPHTARQLLTEARRAASSGQCALMHRHVHAARSALNLHEHLFGRGR